MDNSTLTKMQKHYWEAKQTFLKKVKRKQDDYVVASDAELDAKLELLKSIDETNQNLLNLLDLYQDRVCACAQEECLIGRFMRECGKVDPTKAGKLLAGSGKTLLFASHQFILLRNVLIRVYRDVQTFQYRAVADTFDTVEQMEKARTAYRAALLWMKDISKELDPDAYAQMGKFKKVQEHVRRTKKAFEKLKIDSIQKIDLLSASRCNLFSNVLASYQNNLQSIWQKSSKVMNIFVETFQSCSPSYEFTVLKELNSETVDERFESFEAKIKEILAQDNINEKDMLIFFETDYKDNRESNADNKKPKHKQSCKECKDDGKNKTKTSSKSKLDNGADSKTEKDKKKEKKSSSGSKTERSLLDFSAELSSIATTGERERNADASSSVDLMGDLDLSGTFMPSSLIELDHMHKMDSGNELMQTDFESLLLQSTQQGDNVASSSVAGNTVAPTKSRSTASAQSTNKNNTTLQSWLDLFSDIDPLANPAELDKFSSDKNYIDRNC